MYMDKTLKEMLENPLISRISKDAISKWDLSREEFYGWTLQEIADKMGWRTLGKGFERLFAAAEGGAYYFRLYSEEECREAPEKDGSEHCVFSVGRSNRGSEAVYLPGSRRRLRQRLEPDGRLAGRAAVQ